MQPRTTLSHIRWAYCFAPDTESLAVTHSTCTCWRLPTADGRVLPMRFACLHDEIRVTTRTGQTIQGFSFGAEWFGGPDGPEALLQVDPEGGDSVILEETAIETLTPVEGRPDRSAVLDEVSGLIDRAAAGEQVDDLWLVVGDHETIEVTVRRHVHPCAPPHE